MEVRAYMMVYQDVEKFFTFALVCPRLFDLKTKNCYLLIGHTSVSSLMTIIGEAAKLGTKSKDRCQTKNLIQIVRGWGG
jgi:hypothetical protein